MSQVSFPFSLLWPVVFSFLSMFSSSCSRRESAHDEGPSILPICAPPFYDYETMDIMVGEYSDRLKSKNKEEIEGVLSDMKKEFYSLRPEQMYVASIRAYDVGMRKESVYWFYSAQYRFMLLGQLSESVGANGAASIDMIYSYWFLHFLIGEHIDAYLASEWSSLSGILRAIEEEGRVLPDFEAVFPSLRFARKEEWNKLNEDVRIRFAGVIENIVGHKL